MAETDTISLDKSSASSTAPIASLAIPLSHPAILQGPKPRNPARPPRESTHKDKEREAHNKSGNAGLGGKRRIRRWENAQFHGNPHLHRPTLHDYSPSPPAPSTTSFTPPPPSALFPRSLKVSPSTPTTSQPLSTKAGQYGLSLKGVRKTILKTTGATRGEGGRTEEIIRIVEHELRRWLIGPGFSSDYHTTGAVVIDATPILPPPPAADLPDLPTSSRPQRELPAITELTRSPFIMTWFVPDPFTRFLVHVLARWYGLLSTSFLLGGRRVTKIVRVNMMRPQVRQPLAGGMMDSPPATDQSATEVETTGSELSLSELEETGSELDAESAWDDLESELASVAGDTTFTADDQVDADESGITLHSLHPDHHFDNGTDDELSTTDDEFGTSNLDDSLASLSIDPSTAPTPTPISAPWSSTPVTRQSRPKISFPRRNTDISDSDASETPIRPPPPLAKELFWEMPSESFAEFLWGTQA